MDTASVQVVRAEVAPVAIDYAHPAAGAEIAEAFAALAGGRPFRLPLINERVTIELAGVPSAVANALRRVAKDEIRGRCLTFGPGDFDREATTDPFMDEDFVRTRVRMIRLRPQIPDDVVQTLRFELDAANRTDHVLVVYSGELRATSPAPPAEPLFNPTYEIASLQPGRTLRIRDIRIAEGFGNADAAFTVGVRGVSRPLDLAEIPRAETHGLPPDRDLARLGGAADGAADNASTRLPGAAADQSGFVESSLVANPRRHEVAVTFSAVPPGGRASLTVMVDVCGVVMSRLRSIQTVLEAASARVAAGTSAEATTHRSANASFVVTSDGPRTKGVLRVRGETDTIGNLLSRAVYELMPDIGYVGYTCVPHENTMQLVVAHPVGDPAEIVQIVAQAVRHSFAIFGKISAGVKAALL